MSNNSHVTGRRTARRILIAVLLIGAVSWTWWQATHPSRNNADQEPDDSRAAADGAFREVLRAELELREGVLFALGEDQPFDGLLVENHEPGVRKLAITIHQGRPDGLSRGWFDTGQIEVEETLVKGVSHGLRTRWHPNGQKLSEVMIVDGKLQGTFRRWHDNGVRAEEVELKDSQPDGLSRAYYPSGFQKSQVTLRNGKVAEQKSWKDGESKEAAATKPGLVSGN